MVEAWHDRVVEDAAHTADGYLAGPTFATKAVFRLLVDTAIAVLVRNAQKAEEPALAPVLAPRVANEPVLKATLVAFVTAADAEAVHDDGMVQNHVF